MKYSDRLQKRYEEEIENWFNWETFKPSEIVEDDYGDCSRQQWLGSQTALYPSGKVYAFWTTNQTGRDIIRDSAWQQAIDEVAARHGMFIIYEDEGVYVGKELEETEE